MVYARNRIFPLERKENDEPKGDTLDTSVSSTTSTKPSAADLELTLSQIRGVCAASVILDQNRDVSEIHIVASMERKPKQIVRDVETLLFVKHRVKVDYRKISTQVSHEIQSAMRNC
jgi:hypothetical protein